MVENTAVTAVAPSAFDSEVPAANRDKVQDHNDSCLRCPAEGLSA